MSAMLAMSNAPWGLSRLSRLGSLAPWSPPMLARRIWMGYKTEEEQKKIAVEEGKKLKPVVWSPPGKTIIPSEQLVYRPQRYLQEGTSMDNGYSEKRFNNSDMQQFVSQPIPIVSALTNESYWDKRTLVKRYKKLIDSQRFRREPLMHFGPDLAAAHFLLARNLRVRFKGHAEWAKWDKRQLCIVDGPTEYAPDWYVEAIDASGSQIIYEGFNNLLNLMFLKYLDLSYCDHIDAWCLDRITGEYKDSLEYLDLSGCVSLNWNGLECLWRLKHLKTLVLYDMDHVQDLSLICLMLLEIFPDLQIKGVEYFDTKLLEGTEHEYLLKDLEDILMLEGGHAEQAEKADEGQPNPVEASSRGKTS